MFQIYGESLPFPAVEWLRRHCRIVGRASLSTNQTAKNAGSSSVPTQLPVRLSIEELIILLHEGIVHGLRRTRPISATVTPTDEQLEVFHNSLSRNSEEMVSNSIVHLITCQLSVMELLPAYFVHLFLSKKFSWSNVA